MAVLVDSTNFALAGWVPYSPTVPVSSWFHRWAAPSVDWPQRGAATSVATWKGFRLTRDTTAPTIYITSPPPGTATFSQPVLQLQGYSLEPLASLRYDVANDAGTLTNCEGYVTRQWFDTNLFDVTTNWFECLDIQLTNGANTITLVCDRPGRQRLHQSLQLHSGLLGRQQLAALTLYWPQDGAQVSGQLHPARTPG